MDEREAIARLRRGDWAGLEPLVSHYHLSAVRTAYLVIHDRALAEDLVQAAFLRAAERIGQFDPERPFGPWFLRGVVNDAVKAATRGRREQSLDSDAAAEARLLALAEDWAAGPEAAAEQAERTDAIRAALAALSPEQRGLVARRYYLGLTDNELAHELGVPLGTVKSRLHAARERLRRLLQPWRALDAATAPGAAEGRPGPTC